MNNLFKVKSTQQGLQIDGPLDYANASALLKEVNLILESRQTDIIKINCEEVSRIDSAGIALLIEWKRWCNNNNKQCHFERLPIQANSLIETYRLQEVL